MPLPEAGTLTHASKREDYHMTCFMTSQPLDPRPDPFEPTNGGLEAARTATGQVPGPTAEVMARELESFRQLAASTPALELAVRTLNPESAPFERYQPVYKPVFFSV